MSPVGAAFTWREIHAIVDRLQALAQGGADRTKRRSQKDVETDLDAPTIESDGGAGA